MKKHHASGMEIWGCNLSGGMDFSMNQIYSEEELEHLKNQTCQSGLCVKTALDLAAGDIDPSVLFCLRRKDKLDPKPTDYEPDSILTKLRDDMGFPNLNLNTKEIITSYEKFTFGSNTVGIWRYVRRNAPKGPKPALIYFHGGAWYGGSTGTLENPLKLIAEISDAVIFNVDYSLAPEKPYPNAFYDCYEALLRIYETAGSYGIDENRISVGGDSAGGNLAAAVALRARDLGKNIIYKQILIYPAVAIDGATRDGYKWVDFSTQVNPKQLGFVKNQLAIEKPVKDPVENPYLTDPSYKNDKYVSPLLCESLKDLPPVLMVTAQFDGLRSQDEFYSTLLEKDGVAVRTLRYIGVPHAFFDFLGYAPQTEDLCYEIAKEII